MDVEENNNNAAHAKFINIMVDEYKKWRVKRLCKRKGRNLNTSR